jgi:hypothetical protein
MADAVAALPEGAVPPKLDDLMLAMDVVDTLRHQDTLVARELGQDERDAALKERLRRIYESQGLTVTDRILDEGIAALKESRFVYTPPPPGLGTALARLWVRRGAVAIVAGVLILVLVVVWGFRAFEQSAAEQAAEAARIEVTETLPAAVDKAAAAARAAAADPAAKAAAERLAAEGAAAVKAGDAAAMTAAAAALDALTATLNQTYALRIVARPGEDTGVFRIPEVNEAARNYYLIVEAVTPTGTVLSLPVTSEEDGTTKTVTKWGVRVPQATYDAVRADKTDDGIVEDAVLGEKTKGSLAVTYRKPVSGGAITEW